MAQCGRPADWYRLGRSLNGRMTQSPPGPDFPPARLYSGIAWRDSRATNTMEIASGRGIEAGVVIV